LCWYFCNPPFGKTAVIKNVARAHANQVEAFEKSEAPVLKSVIALAHRKSDHTNPEADKRRPDRRSP
jgi:hypothetical protein